MLVEPGVLKYVKYQLYSGLPVHMHIDSADNLVRTMRGIMQLRAESSTREAILIYQQKSTKSQISKQNVYLQLLLLFTTNYILHLNNPITPQYFSPPFSAKSEAKYWRGMEAGELNIGGEWMEEITNGVVLYIYYFIKIWVFFLITNGGDRMEGRAY